MKYQSFTTATAIAVFYLMLCPACRKDSLADQYDKLTELPNDIAATLDTNTMATTVTSVYVAPVFDPAILQAPCCSMKDEKALKVTFPYTKCAPLRDFIMVPIHELVLARRDSKPGQPAGTGTAAPTNAKIWKLTKRRAPSFLDKIICVTSDGPWNATLTETRACSPPTPHQSLRISPYGDLVTFDWNGGVEFHPANVGLVSCRRVGVFRSNCGISTCDCSSSSCPAADPCDCGLSGTW